MKSWTFIKWFFHDVVSFVVIMTSEALFRWITTKFHSNGFSFMFYFVHFILILHFIVQRRRIVTKLFLLWKIKNSISFRYCWKEYRFFFNFRMSLSFRSIEKIRWKMLFWETNCFCKAVESFWSWVIENAFIYVGNGVTLIF